MPQEVTAFVPTEKGPPRADFPATLTALEMEDWDTLLFYTTHNNFVAEAWYQTSLQITIGVINKLFAWKNINVGLNKEQQKETLTGMAKQE